MREIYFVSDNAIKEINHVWDFIVDAAVVFRVLIVVVFRVNEVVQDFKNVEAVSKKDINFIVVIIIERMEDGVVIISEEVQVLVEHVLVTIVNLSVP